MGTTIATPASQLQCPKIFIFASGHCNCDAGVAIAASSGLQKRTLTINIPSWLYSPHFFRHPFYVRSVSTYQENPYPHLFCFYNNTTYWTNLKAGRFGEKKNKSASDDFNETKSGGGYPRRWRLLSNKSPGRNFLGHWGSEISDNWEGDTIWKLSNTTDMGGGAEWQGIPN